MTLVIRQLYRLVATAMLRGSSFAGTPDGGGGDGRLRLFFLRAYDRVSNLSENTKSVGAALFYGLCSVSMNFLNKAVVSSYEFNYPFFIMACQMLTTVMVLDSLRLLRVIHLRPYSWDEGREFLSASLCFALHATLSLSALHGMNIPMYGAIKRCTPLVSLILSVAVLRKPCPSKTIIFSIITITVGCLVAGIGDLEFDKHAYFMGSLSVFAQGGYLTLVQRSSECKKSTLEMIHTNSYNTLPFFLVMAFVLNEPAAVLANKHVYTKGFYVTFSMLNFSGGILTYSQFLCAAVCSALTASLVGVGKSVIQTSIGFFTFGGVKFHPLNITGICLNTSGACLYTFVKYKESRRRGGAAAKSKDNLLLPLTVNNNEKGQFNRAVIR